MPRQNGMRKQYESPALVKRTIEQAKLLCVGYAWIGHQGAKELLEVMFAGYSESTVRRANQIRESMSRQPIEPRWGR